MDVLTSRTIIRPGDLDRSLAFYRDGLGLAVAREFGHGSQRGRGLLRRRWPDRGGGGGRPSRSASPGDPSVTLWLQVRSVEQALAELTARGVPVARPAVLEPWGLLEAWVDDPDGLRIHLVEVPADHPLRRDQRPAVGEGPPS